MSQQITTTEAPTLDDLRDLLMSEDRRLNHEYESGAASERRKLDEVYPF